jgi:putative addiction module killer protein
VARVLKTNVFATWLDGLKDVHARARVQVRIERLIGGNPGDVEPVGEGVSELRIHHGPGSRTQSSDIKTALRLAREL